MEEFNSSASDGKVEISKDDLSKAIENKLNTNHFVILRYKSQPLAEKIGLLGDHSTISVTILNAEGAEETISFFLKGIPKDEAPAKFALGLGAFEKEIFVYSLMEKFVTNGIEIAASVAPKCYLAKHNECLVLDNLIEEGFQMLDKHSTLDYDAVLVVLQYLARLHASSIIYEENFNENLLEVYQSEFQESFFNDREGYINARGIEASIKCVVKEIEIFEFPDSLTSGKKFADVARRACLQIYDLVKPSKKFRNVLCHGDLWATNFLLNFDGKGKTPIRCKFVDFQCGRYVPPSQDVLSFIYLTTSREFRKKYMYQVIGMYYSYLEKYLKSANLNVEDIISFSDFLDSCEEQKLFAIVQTAIYFPLILIKTDEVEQYFSDKSLNEKALFEDRSYLVLAHKDKDESYADRLKESIQDLKEYCERL